MHRHNLFDARNGDWFKCSSLGNDFLFLDLGQFYTKITFLCNFFDRYFIFCWSS